MVSFEKKTHFLYIKGLALKKRHAKFGCDTLNESEVGKIYLNPDYEHDESQGRKSRPFHEPQWKH